MDDAVPSIADILQIREWKHALFTTYTLSLSYFESEALPSLIRAGCSDIWLIADAEGYRSSLLERHSMRVGHEYRLVPAALSNGVFHPKSIYLSSDEGDLLLVGSGNVTFAGHGRNLEVFEALTPETHGTAFADFASYLEAMRARDDIAFARTEWIDDFAARALGASGSSEGPVRLLHSLTDAVIKQLPIILAEHGPCSSVSVMSPYHDPDGLAVKRLSEELNGVPVSVAVTGKDTSPFPFAAAFSWGVPITPIRLASKDKRFIHAKLFEFSCAKGPVVLSGSINATRKALATTENVELGVLRALPSDSSFLDWEAIEAPTFEAQSRIPSGLKENEIVYAAFDRNEVGLLTGQILSLQPVAGVWSGCVIQADGDAAPRFEAEVDAQGRFSHEAAALERFFEMPALQIVMTCDNREARGWVHNEMFLSMPGRRRLTAGSLSRLMRREGADDDIEALLDYLSVHAENHLRIFDLPVRKDNSEEEVASETAVITANLEDLAPIEEVKVGNSSAGGSGHSLTDAFDIAMWRLRKVFLGHGRNKTIAASNFGESVVAGEDTGDDGSADNKSKSELEKRGLSDFEAHMDNLIKDSIGNPSSVRPLLVLKLEVGMWMRVYRFSDLNDANEFLHSWFYQACRLAEPEGDKVSSLEQHVVTNSAIIFAVAADGNRDAVALSLHDSLEHFYRGDADRGRLHDALVNKRDVGFGAILIGEKVSDKLLVNALTEILSHPTTRQQIIRALKLAEAAKQIPSEWGVFQSKPGAILLQALQSLDWKKKVRAVKRKTGACAFDHYDFSVAVTSEYRRYRIGQCIHCKRFTLDVSP